MNITKIEILYIESNLIHELLPTEGWCFYQNIENDFMRVYEVKECISKRLVQVVNMKCVKEINLTHSDICN